MILLHSTDGKVIRETQAQLDNSVEEEKHFDSLFLYIFLITSHETHFWQWLFHCGDEDYELLAELKRFFY